MGRGRTIAEDRNALWETDAFGGRKGPCETDAFDGATPTPTVIIAPEVERRMARVPYVTREELEPEHRDLIVSSLQPGKTRNVYASIANNPEVLSGLREFFGALWSDSGLTDRQRELVILTAASEIGSAYEWHQHVNIALDVGISAEEIAAIARDDRSPFSTSEAALIAYTRAVARGRVEDPHHEAIAEFFDDGTVVGIAATAASYAALGNLLDAFDVELEADEEFVGWEPTQ